MLFQHHKLPQAKQLVLTKNGISACYMLWLLLPKQEFLLHFQWILNSLGWQCDMGIRRWVKLTVFTYSEIYLINYFHLEMVVWDYILAVILLFGQIVHFTGHAGKHKLIRKTDQYFHFDYAWYTKRKNSHWTDFKIYLFTYWKWVVSSQ